MNARITKIRKDSDMTQEQFAKKMGISANYVNLIENGRKVPGDRLVSDICREFGVRVEWLKDGTEPMKLDSDIEFADLCFQIGAKDEMAKRVLEEYLRLNEEDKKLFWDFLERLTKK